MINLRNLNLNKIGLSQTTLLSNKRHHQAHQTQNDFDSLHHELDGLYFEK